MDASVLYKILQAVRDRFPEYEFSPPSAVQAQARRYISLAYRQPFNPKHSCLFGQMEWRDPLQGFTKQAEKIAFRNSPSNQNRLLEEELFLGVSGVPGKLERSDDELVHRAKQEMSEIVVALRREIMGVGQEEAEYEADEDEDLDELERRIVDEEGSLDGWGDDQSDASASSPASPPPPPSRRSSEEDAKRMRAIYRSYNAVHYAFDVLSAEGKEPFGTRLFGLVALETLLSLIKKRMGEAA